MSVHDIMTHTQCPQWIMEYKYVNKVPPQAAIYKEKICPVVKKNFAHRHQFTKRSGIHVKQRFPSICAHICSAVEDSKVNITKHMTLTIIATPIYQG